MSFIRPRRVLGNGRQPIDAEHHNELARCIEQLQDEITALKGGKALAVAPAQYAATIVPKRFKKVEDEWKVIFHPAKLFEFSLVNAGVGHEITSAGGNLTADPPPEISLAVGTNEVWLQWTLEPNGVVTSGTPELTIGDAPEGTPMQPDRPEDANVDGLIIQQIGLIFLEEEGRPTWLPIAPHVSSHCYSPGIENLGDGISLWESYDPGTAKDKWRTIRQVGEDGEDIIKDHDSETLGETIDFRQIMQKLTDPQIHVAVSGSGNELEIKGNSVNQTITGLGGFAASFADGLFTGGTSANPESAGVHCNLEIWESTFDSEGGIQNTESQKLGTLFFRFGRLVRVEWDGNTLGGEIDDTGIDPEDILSPKVSRNVIPE